MIINGKMGYKRALILDSDKISELEVILKQFVSKIEYEVETQQGTSIEFAGKDELLNYDNFGKKKIKTLTVSGYNDYKRIICLEFGSVFSLNLFRRYGSVFEGKYKLSTVNEEAGFQKQINDWLNKSTASYWLVGKFSLFRTLFYLCALITFYNAVNNAEPAKLNLSISHFILLVFISFVLVWLTYAFDKYIMESLFPSISFLWGEEVKRQKKMTLRRSNVFWAVIIALVVGVIAGIISTVFSRFLLS